MLYICHKYINRIQLMYLMVSYLFVLKLPYKSTYLALIIISWLRAMAIGAKDCLVPVYRIAQYCITTLCVKLLYFDLSISNSGTQWQTVVQLQSQSRNLEGIVIQIPRILIRSRHFVFMWRTLMLDYTQTCCSLIKALSSGRNAAM